VKIALVHLRHARTGGTERYLNHLARHLAEQGHEVAIVCRRHAEAPHPAVRFEVLRSPALGASWRLLAFGRAVEAHVARGDYDVVLGLGKTWTHDVVRLGGGLHGTYLRLAHEETLTPGKRLLGSGRLRNRLVLAIEKRALAPGAAQQVIVNSEMVRRDVLATYGLSPERVVVIHNGVDLEQFHPRRRGQEGLALRRELGLDARAPVVLFLGTGYGRKGLDLLLDAFARVLRGRPEARLVVAGYDSGRARYEARARDLGISAAVRFLGGRGDPEACYAAADVYALPTRYDPFANTTLEALASGVPVATTAANGGAEVLAPDAGAVVAPDPEAFAAALALLLEPEGSARRAAAARACAELHSIGSKLARTTAVLEQVAAAGARR
jgi:UDP-glucose:(heptosyl)LPS alpha-1,3-glucosyltransferase